MITRQDLEDYRYRNIELEQQFSKIKMWQSRITRLQTSYGAAHRSTMPECYQLIDELRQLADNALLNICQIKEKYQEVDALINAIPNPKIRMVMCQYYTLCAPDWDEVAAILDIPKRTVYRLHGYGLEIIKHMQKELCMA